jgi:trk system potassium uptake protein TrkA
MHKKKTYAVFGLGRYGIAVARELVDNGKEVIAVDNDQRIVNDAAAYLPVCKCADVSDAEVISRLGIGNIDTVIVCMASNLEASVMAVTLCKEAGVQKVIAKCGNEMHQKILLRVGADQVVFPEYESGVRLAKNLLSSGFIDMFSLSKDVSMVEIDVKEEWIGKNLIELSLRKKYSINVVAIRNGDEIITTVEPTLPLKKDMQLLVIANTINLRKLK